MIKNANKIFCWKESFFPGNNNNNKFSIQHITILFICYKNF